MAHIALNPEMARGNVRSVIDCPDTLQELCVFYLMNNIDILVQSLNTIKDTNEEFTSLFSMLHSSRMLAYYNKCGIPCDHELPYNDQLTKFFYQCEEITVNSTIALRSENIKTLADSCKSVRKLDLTCFDDDIQLPACRRLLENNLPHLTSLKLSQKCEECSTIGFLNVLCGRDFDADIPDSKKDIDENNDDDDSSDNDDDDSSDNDDSYHDGDDGTAVAAADDDKQRSTSSIKEIEGENVDRADLQIGNIDSMAVTGSEPIEDKNFENIPDKVISNLKSFTYLQVHSQAHPNFEPCRSFGWFYDLLSRVISSNHLQSFKLMTIISNPIEWFMSQPDLSGLKDLQSLSLSLELMDSYVAYSGEIDMPYTDKFFTNLPVLQNLRHLDISCSIPIEDYMSENFTYPEEIVEMFVEALKLMPQLKSLDISGTNLATIICHTDKGDKKCRDHCMPGFEDRQFDFLGLYGTDTCTHKFIPADRVSGTASIEQLVEALKSLQHNMMLMSAVIEDISHWVKNHNVDSTDGLALIDGLVMFVTQLGEWNNSGSADEFEQKSISIALETIFSLVEDHDVVGCFTVRRKRLLLEQLLNVCHILCTRVRWNFRATTVTAQRTGILENAMMLIQHLDLDHTAMYTYKFKQYIQVSLEIFNSPVNEIAKLSSLKLLHRVFKKYPENMEVAGRKLEFVKKLLKAIKEKASSALAPKMWKILRTLTGGVSYNCDLFVQNEGLELSRTCIDRYSDDKDLCEVIIKTLVNVVENPDLIVWLMTSDMLSMIKQRLSYENEKDFGVSSSAIYFLIILASYGPKVWTVVKPSRDEILEKVDQVMHKWDMNRAIARKIRWPISTVVSQFDNYSTPVAQYWAALIMCRLVIDSPKDYCEMVESRVGLAKIDSMLQRECLRDDIRILFEKIRELTRYYKK